MPYTGPKVQRPVRRARYPSVEQVLAERDRWDEWWRSARTPGTYDGSTIVKGCYQGRRCSRCRCLETAPGYCGVCCSDSL